MIRLNKENDNYIVASFAPAVKKLNILVADKTKKVLNEVIDVRPDCLILNLENISYIDSSGLGAIVSVFNYAKNCDVKFVVCNVSESNMALVKVTKLNEVLSIYPDMDTAIAAIQE